MTRLETRAQVLALLILGMVLAPALVGCRSRETPVHATPSPSPTAISQSSPLPSPEAGAPEAEVPQAEAAPRGKVIFHRKEQSGWIHIYVLDLDTQELTALTDGRANNYDPAWAPDGRQVAFISDRDPESTYGTLWLMGADGSDQRALLDGGPYVEMGPSWSPDGTRIAFQSDRQATNPEILVFDLESQELVNLTSHPNVDANPAWSPDGLHIAFVSDRSGNPEIWVVGADGAEPRRITDSPTIGDWRPAWSPDSRSLIFESFTSVPPRRLFIRDIDGGEARGVETFSIWNTWPAWPQEDLVLYAAPLEYDSDLPNRHPAHIYLQRLDTGEADQLTSGKGDDGRPSWTP